MKYLHVNKIEDYHPGYKDRDLVWCKIYFKMFFSDPDFEMLCEIDQRRFITFIALELKTKKPIPLDEAYLSRKGFDLKKRPISLTLQMLQSFVSISTDSLHNKGENTSLSSSLSSSSTDTNIRVDTNIYVSIVCDLNEVLKTAYKPTSKTIRDLVNARLKDGFTLENFKTVHRNMSAAWGKDEKMKAYLRPITLYSNKFESYLNFVGVKQQAMPACHREFKKDTTPRPARLATIEDYYGRTLTTDFEIKELRIKYGDKFDQAIKDGKINLAEKKGV